MASDGEISCTNDPNFAVIYSFLKVFGKLYGLEVPTIAKLQESIENTQEVLDPLKDLHLRLLRRALKSVQSNRWERCLIKFCHQQGNHQEAWEIERFSYKKASTQVKLKVLKLLLEYQFTCHPKFKSAVNTIVCKELRLDPIGRDKNGCVYWYQVDDDANLCLYKEDQDEETWQVVARNREQLVKVISQLKSGEDVCSLFSNTVHDDSNSGDAPAQLEPKKEDGELDNEEEFLSPESESDHEETVQDNEKISKCLETVVENTNITKTDESSPEKNETEIIKIEKLSGEEEPKTEDVKEEHEGKSDDQLCKENEEPCKIVEDLSIKDTELIKDNLDCSTDIVKSCEEDKLLNSEDEGTGNENQKLVLEDKDLSIENKEIKDSKDPDKLNVDEKVPDIAEESEAVDLDKSKSDSCPNAEEVSEAIEEPVMVVKGEGSGADCDSSYIGEEIIEQVMFFYGEGSGYDNDTGNPDTIEQAKSPEKNSDAENGNEDLLNGEHTHELTNSNSKNNKLSKSVKLKGTMPAVSKRALKKQPNDTNELLKSDSKKHCIRNSNKSDSSNSKSIDKKVQPRVCVTDKSNTESEGPWKSRIKKGRSKVKKKKILTDKSEVNDGKDVNNVAVNCNDSKTSIIEKRKSSVSSVEHEDGENVDTEKEKSPEKDLKAEEPLPPKKLRLESTPESDLNESHSIEKDPLEMNNSDLNNEAIENQDDKIENSSIAQRKKIKATKGKFKRKKLESDNNTSVLNKSTDKDESFVKEKKNNKSLKRSLLDATMSDKNKSESHSESEDDEPVTSGKRLKIRPKKISKSSRKKVEAKLLEKHSTDESEEETLYSIAAGKKASKKVLKKKPKGKEQVKPKAKGEKGDSEDSDVAPVRQSRRIAQMKIKEEADRRHLEEVALRELKMIHKKKNKDEEEWVASGASSSEGEKVRVRKSAAWRAADSTGPDQDSDSDEPLFDVHDEPDLEFNKSDHEFSPESDLESGDPVEPLKRARTLQEGKDDGFCKRCGSGEQPEWILLCDRCDGGYHASCLKPLLLLVPEGDWFCPPCNHDMLIKSLESELTKYDELVLRVEEERARKKEEEPEPAVEEKTEKEKEKEDDSQSDGSGSSSWSSGSAGVYRLRTRRALPVSYRAQEYDRLISSAIKEEYVEPTTSAGNQGRGKDISTIIEAAEEQHREAQRDARQQGLPVELKKFRKKSRRKPRKLNSLEVPSEDDDETDEDFKDTGLETSSEDISSSAERDSSNESRSSDSLPIRRTGRIDKKDRPKLRESSPEVKKKKKGVLDDTSSESGGTKEWSHKKPKKSRPPKRRDKSSKSHKHSGLKQYDAMGNVIRARVTYGGLSPEPNDWSPKHRTRQKKINYTEMPNTESEDEMHKSSGKHMPDSSDEFKVDDDSEFDSDSDSDRAKRRKAEAEQSEEERRKALSDLIKKTVVVPLEKLPEDVTKAKTEELQAHLNAQAASTSGTVEVTPGSAGRGRGRGRGRGGRGRGRGRVRPHDEDDALAKLVGVKIKDLKADGTPVPANQAEKEKRRQEREAKLAEKEAKRLERLQKKEEKEKLKEQKAKEREEKRQARIALQESKRVKKEKPFFPVGGNLGYGVPVRQMGPDMPRPPMYPNSPVPVRHPADFQEQQRFPNTPRLQVRAELRGVLTAEDRMQNRQEQPPNAFREGTLSVAGSPQPYKPITEEPSIITRMPHMINQQYRGPMMYPPNNYGPRGQNMGVYPVHAMRQYPPGYNPYLSYRGPMRPPGPSPSPLGPGHNPHGPNLGPSGHGPSPNLGPTGHGPSPNHGPTSGHGPSPNHGHNLGPSPLAQSPGPPRHMQPGHPSSIRGPPPNSMHRPNHPLSLRPTPPPATPPNPTPTPPTSSPNPTPSPSEPFKIKAEVKTEPEYRSPAGSPSPRPPSPEPPRNHPKIKHTENKDRRPRYPLGPYAPQFGPYGPYDPALQRMHQMQYLPNEREDPNLPPPYLRGPRPPFMRASPPYRPPFEPRSYGEARPQYDPRTPYESIRPSGEPRPAGPYGESPRPSGPYSEQSRPTGPYPDGARPPGPYPEGARPPGSYAEGPRPSGPYSEGPRPTGPFTEGPRPTGPFTEGLRPTGPYSEGLRSSGPFGEGSKPTGSFSEGPRPPGTFAEGSRPAGSFTESTRPPGPYGDSIRTPGPYTNSQRPPGPYRDSIRPPGPYSDLPRPPGSFGDSARSQGPYADSTRLPGPFGDLKRPPGSFSESPRPPGPFGDSPRPPGPYSESPRPPGPFGDSTRLPGPYSESPRPSGPFSESPRRYTESPRPPGPYTESPRPPGPYTESPRPPGPYTDSPRSSGPFGDSARLPSPYTESPRPPRPFTESPRPPGPFTESPRPLGPYGGPTGPPGPYMDQSRPPGPYTDPTRLARPYVEPTRPPGPYSEPSRPPGPYTEPTRPPGPYNEPTRPPGPFNEPTRPPGPFNEPTRPPGPFNEPTRPPGPFNESTKPPGPYTEPIRPSEPYTEQNRPPAPYAEPARPVNPAMREDREDEESSPLEERPESRETPQPEVSNGQVLKSPPPAPPQPYNRPDVTPVSLSIKPEPGEGEPPREEGSVFGGLVSYFSSQHEDDLDT